MMCVDDLRPSSKSTIVTAVREMRTGDQEASHFIKGIIGCHVPEIYATIAAFLGESQDTSGGTMGAPLSPPIWMRALNKALLQALCAIGVRYYFIGKNKDDESPFAVGRCGAPLNAEELFQQFGIMYSWHLLQFHDQSGVVAERVNESRVCYAVSEHRMI